MSKRKILNALIYEKEQEIEELRQRQDELIAERRHGFAALDKRLLRKQSELKNLKKRRGASVEDEIEYLEKRKII